MDKFYGSKLNTVLLLILIVLMVFALKIMLQDKEIYFPQLKKNTPVVDKSLPKLDIKDGIEGRKDDLISFTILPYTKVHGILSYRGVIKGGYFFEGNILINVFDKNKKVIFSSNAVAKGEWMTAEPVSFEGNIDFTLLPKGPAYIEIHNDNASGLPENDKSILIPIVIE